MRYLELTESYRTIEDVIEAFKIQHADDIKFGCEDGACGHTTAMFADFAGSHGFPSVEIVKGFFKADEETIQHQWNEYSNSQAGVYDKIIDFTGYEQFVKTGLANDVDPKRYTY